MANWLVSFANATFKDSQRRLSASARAHGIANIRAFGPSDLRGDAFVESHRDIFSRQRGVGYWLWKPLLIRRVMNEMADGDILFYLDSGVEIIDSIKPLETLAAGESGIVTFCLRGRKIGDWTKRDCLILLDCDSPEYYEQEQVNAAYVVIRKCARSIAFVEEWLKAAADARTITDDPNVLGQDDLPLFVEHRHDQAVLSLLVRKHRLPVYREPSKMDGGNDDDALAPPTWADSPYGRIFNHHGNRRRSIASLPGRVLNRVWGPVSRKAKVRSLFPTRSIHPFIEQNRATLAKVPRWIDETVYKNSVFQYGLPERVRSFIDLPLNGEATYSDAMMYLSTFLARPVNYLELGVSVGKNFAQSLHALKNASLTALDIEDINPTLEKFLSGRKVTEIADPLPSARKNPIRVSDYVFPANNNTVRYSAGDGMHELSWQPLTGKKYNLIFSDMLHEPEGLLFEYEMFKKLDLIDGDEFIMAWDDLGGLMEVAFWRIAADMRRKYGQLLVTTVSVRGWLGANEGYHTIGLVAKLPAYQKTLGAGILAELLTVPTAARR